MKNILILITLLSYLCPITAQDEIILTNKTGLTINQLEYWLGSLKESNDANLIYKSRGTIKNDATIKIPEKFHHKRRGQLLIKASLNGGGYIKTSYSINKGENKVKMELSNPGTPVPKDDHNKVITKFRELKFDDGFLKISKGTGLKSVLGALYIYNNQGQLIYKVSPDELKSKLEDATPPKTRHEVSGIFSSETFVSAGISLPFVTSNMAFEYGDVAKIRWIVKDAGEFIWSPPNGKGLTTLFEELPTRTKETLLYIFKNNKGVTMKFIDRVYIIGHIDVRAERSKLLKTNIEVTASSFVTAKGNYKFKKSLKQEDEIGSVITNVSGYPVTDLLSILEIIELTQKEEAIAQSDAKKIEKRYNLIKKLYPDMIPKDKVESLDLMKQIIAQVSDKFGGKISYLIDIEKIKTTNSTDINLADIEIKTKIQSTNSEKEAGISAPKPSDSKNSESNDQN